jgi:hypothetical protein
MTNFDKFNPGTNNNPVNPLNFGKTSKPDASDPSPEEGDANESAASLAIPPDQMLDMLAAQSMTRIPLQKSESALFKGMPNLEQHRQISQTLSNAYTEEFGSPPSPHVLQDMVDNHIIGTPVISQ